MPLSINGSNQQYLFNLQTNQARLQQISAQLSSGARLQQVSDDPSAVGQIYQLQTEIAVNQRVQANLSAATGELNAADTALQSSIAAVQKAVSLASEGASTATSAETRANLATQVQGILETVVGLSQTRLGNTFIFSGDQSNSPSYQLDASQAEGVKQLITSASTRAIQDVNGTTVARTLTAQQIFDPQGANGGPATGNTFAALQALVTALNNNDTAGIVGATDSLKGAGDYLNSRLAVYGEAESRVTDAVSLAQKFLSQEQQSLSQVKDADVPTLAVELTATQAQQQAALSVEAKIQQLPNLFSLLA